MGRRKCRRYTAKRTDLGELPNYRTHRHRLYGEQEGVCAGCDTHFPFKVMEVDHVLPKSRGGTDHFENLQLLCSHCNQQQGQQDNGGMAGEPGILEVTQRLDRANQVSRRGDPSGRPRFER